MRQTIRGSGVPKTVLALLSGLAVSLAPSVAPTYADSPSCETTPIKHLVVIFQENISFYHYFGTYLQPRIPPVSRNSMPGPELRP